MILSFEGKPLPPKAVEEKTMGSGGITYAIWWNRLNTTVMTYDKINELLDKLDNKKIPYKETKNGCYTLSRISLLGEGYFIRKDKNDKNRIEVCGGVYFKKDLRLFRYSISQSYIDDFGALDAWIEFKNKVNQYLGVSVGDIFGGLPEEYHKYRKCVPSPINWAHPAYTLSDGLVSGECVKADICSAYGTEASKVLPDCHEKLLRREPGRIEPTEDYPFAFYLNSGNMAIYQEGNTYQLNKSSYITNDHTVFIPDSEEETLLLPATKHSLRSVFEDLYDGRKDNPNNKGVMNMTIGMFHRKKYTYQEDNLWPVAAVVKFRCNKRIVDMCEELKSRGQVPLLINTDSILWEGNDTEGFATEKKLGNFTIENRRCLATIRSSKIYQVFDLDTEETETRWSGSHTKKYTSLLAFGRIWDPEVYEYLREVENKNTIKWSETKRRYINKLGENYITQEELPEWILK